MRQLIDSSLSDEKRIPNVIDYDVNIFKVDFCPKVFPHQLAGKSFFFFFFLKTDFETISLVLWATQNRLTQHFKNKVKTGKK